MADPVEARGGGDGSAGSSAARVRWSTLVITNAIKVTGLVFAARELATTKDMGVLIVCVVMMSGAQSLEQVLIAFLQRFLGVTPK
jgi:hypothetical protein